MRLGCCGSIDQSETYKSAGFDFVEVNIQGVLKGTVDDQTWAADAPNPDTLALPIEAANCLVPGNMPIVGPDRDFDALTVYMNRVAERARKLGIQRLVFGSGGARKRPAGVEPDDAFKQLVAFAQMAGDACGGNDVVLVIEHLNKGETNTLNSLEACMQLHEAVQHPHVQVLVDSYHYGLEDEDDEALLTIGDHLMHVHIAEPIDRIQPGGHDDPSKSFDFEHFFALCRKLGYDERVSFEGKWTKPVEEIGSTTAALIRDAWARAGS